MIGGEDGMGAAASFSGGDRQEGAGARARGRAGRRRVAAVVVAAVLAGPLPAGAAEPVAAAGTVEAGDPALGEYLAGECVTCHQLSGRDDGIPAIVGRPAAWLIEAMGDYRARRRANPVMQTIAGRYSAAEIAALAAYFAQVGARPPP